LDDLRAAQQDHRADIRTSILCRRHPIAVWLRGVIGPARVLAISIRLICTGFRPVPVRAMAVRVLAFCAWCLTGPTSFVRVR
jgi:hypothetical protein